MESSDGNGQLAKELQADLARKYRRHSTRIDGIWRSFDQRQRVRCFKSSFATGGYLKHALDRSVGDSYLIAPEMNLRDVAESDPDYLLGILKHRATSSVYDQFFGGPDGSPGDQWVIGNNMRTRNLQHSQRQAFKNCYSVFWDEDKYGWAMKVDPSHKEEVLAGLKKAIQAGLLLSQEYGELILIRQITILQVLHTLVEDILNQGSKTRGRKQLPDKQVRGAADTFSKLTISPPPAKLSLEDLVASARSQKDVFREYQSLLSSEPVVLVHAVNQRFFSHPGLVPDEKGRRLPAHTDKYISIALFDAVHDAVRTAATWTYIDCLLALLEKDYADKVYRPILLQELSNVCHLEFSRTQVGLKRAVQTASGAKQFKRVSQGLDKQGNERVNIKGDPEEFFRSDPQLHYLLRLCQAETTAPKAVDWVVKLSALHVNHPEDEAKMETREAQALGDMMAITGFMRDLSSVVSMPPLSRKKGQMFVSRSQELETELNQTKGDLDLRDFASPIGNLLDPGMALASLGVLDKFVVQKTGTKLGILYEDLIEDSLADLKNRHHEAKEKLQPNADQEWVPLPVSSPQPPELRVDHRREKDKTRPSHFSAYEITPQPAPAEHEATTTVAQIFKVSSSAADTFWRLFDKSQSRGSISWTAFEAAMAELGFSMMPKFGSIYTFLPPELLNVRKSVAFYRPHRSHIEGFSVPIFARRLNRVYGWKKESFETA
ncbi:hypothetical protein MCOR27_004032 [Pyricularia oryzae]|uniref:Ipa protein n=1 Tax=Pyricularia grisea TaxID=148305 RepID=A0ABQ8NM63_PYRGI|nr:hypothetical protein MCOR01_004947 [Pyricularia oryzae]KAI6298644.1 hypothetical protein MCOR33_005290 [Pyricularia grisea]KAH9431692.1 hypothetical protein MCOR02_008980 [Pyricularia oryzae]KAI6258011.1 hypothetical protein MCOR19_005596 [Pyricularia oryzae]KAI6267937.1 hypothetical protein MCOR26_009437 [Pyricularia oryzae]